MEQVHKHLVEKELIWSRGLYSLVVKEIHGAEQGEELKGGNGLVCPFLRSQANPNCICPKDGLVGDALGKIL